MTRPLSVGVAGLGTVGVGVLKLLRDNADVVAARATGRAIAAYRSPACAGTTTRWRWRVIRRLKPWWS